MYRKRCLLLIILIGSLYGLSGCKGVDIDNRNLVVGFGVDAGKSAQYRVTLKVAATKSDPNAAKSEFFILDEEANSIAYAVEALQAKSEKLLDFSQTKVIVMGEEIARENMKQVLDYAIRTPGIQLIAWMAVARPNANDLLKVKRTSENPVSIFLNDMFTNMQSISIYLDAVPLSKFYTRFYERGADPYLPILEHKKGQITAERLALFDKKGMKLELKPEEVSFFKLINKRQEIFHYELQAQGEEERMVTILRDSKVRYSLKEDTQPPKVKYDIRLRGTFEEAGNESLAVSADASAYASQESREIRFKLEKLLRKIQREGLDPLGFGLHYLSSQWNPKGKWETWQALYPRLEFEADVVVQLRSEGFLK